MAYVDKLTNMRRMALIRPKSNIIWEGVNIEGICVLKKVDVERNGITIKIIKEEDIKGFCEADYEYLLECKYQDKGGGDWEPRKELEEKEE